MKSQVLSTVWCNISGEAAGKIWNWSLLGVKGLNTSIRRSSRSWSQKKPDSFVNGQSITLGSRCDEFLHYWEQVVFVFGWSFSYLNRTYLENRPRSLVLESREVSWRADISDRCALYTGVPSKQIGPLISIRIQSNTKCVLGPHADVLAFQ